MATCTTTILKALNQEQHRPNVGLWLRIDIIMYITWLGGVADCRLRVSVVAPVGFVAELPTPAGKWGSTPRS